MCQNRSLTLAYRECRFDTSGFIVEHYADGDLVNKNTPVSNEEAGPQTLSVWGPPVPEVF